MLTIPLPITPEMAIEIMRLVDLQPATQAAPPAFFDLQAALGKAIDANPDFAKATVAARSAVR